jgi:hypothetical protein
MATNERTRRANLTVAPLALRDTLRAAVLSEGETETCERLGVARLTIARAVAGFWIAEATILLLEAKLAAPAAPSRQLALPIAA